MPEQSLVSISGIEILTKDQGKQRDAFNIRHQRTNLLVVNSTPRAQAIELSDKETEKDDMTTAR